MHTPVLKKLYQEQVVPELKKKLGVTNPHQVPALTKVVINSSYRADTDKNLQAEILKEIGKIAGQKPVVTHARKSVSNFKVRQGMPLGVMVTLRGAAMYEFLARLIYIALPMIRDFRGVSNRFDGKGNYSLGIADHTIFPETQGDGSQRQNIGLDITIVTTAKTDDEGRELLRLKGQGYNTVCPDCPQPAWFYALCDETGLYVIDRAAISAPERRGDRTVGGTPSNDPRLADEYLERVKAMYYRSRNFTCVVAFALGAPSGNGYNMYKAYEWLKSVEKSRPVIYEDADGEWNSDL